MTQLEVTSSVLTEQRISNLEKYQNILRTESYDAQRRSNDVVKDFEKVDAGYIILSVQRGDKEYQILLNNQNKIIGNDHNSISTKVLGNNDFFIASFPIYAGRQTQGHYIKDLQNDRDLVWSLESDYILDVKKQEGSDLYIISSNLQNFLVRSGQGIIDRGCIQLLGDNMYKKYTERWHGGDPFDDISFNKLIKNENDTYEKIEFYKATEFHGTTNSYLPNVRFDYQGDDIMIKSSPNLGNDAQGKSSSYLSFAQAIDIKTDRKGPQLSGRLFFISKNIYAYRKQILTDYNRTAIVPYLSFIDFNGIEITQKPYYEIKKIGSVLFAKPICEDHLTTYEGGNKRYPSPSNTIINDHNSFGGRKNPMEETNQWVIIDKINFDTLNNDIFCKTEDKDNYIECERNDGVIMIYDYAGNLKAEDILNYKDFNNGQLRECNVSNGQKIYYDKNRDELKL